MTKREMTVLQIRIDKELKDRFTKYCKELGTTPSDELRRYMTKKSKWIKRRLELYYQLFNLLSHARFVLL